MAHIFVSHSTLDEEQAKRLLAWLRAEGFDQTFLDVDKHGGIAPGTEWEKKLYREMVRAEAVILVLTKNWLDSKWCFVEFAQARALGKAIFPLIETPKGETYVAPDIQNLDLTLDRVGGLERLAVELRRIALDAQGQFPWDIARSPFPGLLAFDEADAAVYFGRDDDIRRLIERLNARRAQGGAQLIVLLGASGSGKSSLMRAGLLPRLKRDKRNWIVLPPFRPQLHPIDELAQTVTIALGQPAEWRTWRERFSGPNVLDALFELARDLRAAHGGNEAQILISIDQGEELFGAADKNEAAQFFTLLNAMLDERLPFLTLMGLRSDYLNQVQQTAALTAPFEEFSLKPMPIDRVRQIIEGPAQVAGLHVDGALVTAAMKDAATDDALPLLAFALRELYDRSGKSKQFSLTDYRALGDDSQGLSPLENVVRRRAEEVLSAAKPGADDLAALKEAFVPAMVRINAEGEYVRRPARLDDLPAKALPLLDRLGKARLLVTRQEDKTTYVEVAHEALLRKWPLLRGWIDEEREFLIGKEQLKQELNDWEGAAEAQKNDALLTGLKLTRARLWLSERPRQLSNAERDFITASVARQAAEQTRRERLRRYVLTGSIAAAAILAVVAATAIWQRGVATNALALAQLNYQLALKQAAGSIGLITKSFNDGAISNKLMQQLVEMSQETLKALPGESDDVTAARSRLLDMLTNANLVLGNIDISRNFVKTEIELAEKLTAKDPNNQQWLQLAEMAHGQMSEVWYWGGDSASGALEEARLAKDVAAKLVALAPDSDDYQRDLMNQYRRIGDDLSDVGQVDEATATYQSMLKIAEDRSARSPDSTEWQAAVAYSHQELGDVQLQQFHWAAAAVQYRASLDIVTKLLRTDPNNSAYLNAHAETTERYGDTFLGQDQITAALEQYTATLQDSTALAKLEPTNLRWQQLLETSHQRLGEVDLKLRKFTEALGEFQTYLALAEAELPAAKSNGGALYDVTNAQLKVGDGLREMGDLDGARAAYEKSLANAKTLNALKWNGSWSKVLAIDYQRIGLVLTAQGKIPDAIEQFKLCTQVKVIKLAWSPRAVWPQDVNDFCRKQIAELEGGTPH